MVATETAASDASPRRRGRLGEAVSVGGFLATAIVIALCAVVMVDWDAGLAGDLLLGAAAVGVLVRLPHTVAIWAALTLLAATALALAFNGEALASRFADLAYYGLAVGCLWALWDLALERLRWRLPGTALHAYLVRMNAYPSGVALLLGVVALAGTAILAYAIGLAGLLLAGLALVGLLRGLRYTAALWAGLALAVGTGLLAAGGEQRPAVYTGLLAVCAVVAAALWVCWQALTTRYCLRWQRGKGDAEAGDGGPGGEPHVTGRDQHAVHV